MLLNSQQLFETSKDTFMALDNESTVICKVDIRMLARFSAVLEQELFKKRADYEVDMPIEISSIEFAMARIESYKKACESLQLKDKRQKNLIGKFGMKLQRNLFYGKE